MRYACDWTAATVPQGRRTGYTERLVRIKTRAIAKLCHTFATRLLRRFIARKLRRVLITAVPRTINGINFFFFPFFFWPYLLPKWSTRSVASLSPLRAFFPVFLKIHLNPLSLTSMTCQNPRKKFQKLGESCKNCRYILHKVFHAIFSSLIRW